MLAGTVLMATGISGYGPGAHESSQTLAVLMPGIARYRDQFYQHLLARMSGPQPPCGRMNGSRPSCAGRTAGCAARG